MWTKSKIQLIKEHIKQSNECLEILNHLMDKYIIEDSIFIYKDGTVWEATQGYFEVINSSNDLKTSINEWVNNLQEYAIRIIDNKQFEVGKLKNSLLECDKESNILDVSTLKYIR